MSIEAVCDTCGEVFIPTGEEDDPELPEHYYRNDGRDWCGGTGRIAVERSSLPSVEVVDAAVEDVVYGDVELEVTYTPIPSHTISGFIPDPHPKGRAGWLLYMNGHRMAVSRGERVKVWRRN